MKQAGRKAAIQKNKSDNKGFTLVEVVVSMLILALVTVPLLGSFVTSVSTNSKAKEMKAATDFAQQVMESLQSYGADRVNAQFWNGHSYVVKGEIQPGTYSGESFSVIRGLDSSQVWPVLSLDGEGTDITGSGNIRLESVYAQGTEARRYIVVGGATNGRSYDVKICYDPAPYSGSRGSSASGYNSAVFSDLSVFNRKDSAIVSTNRNLVTNYNGEILLGPASEDPDAYAYEWQGTTVEEAAIEGFYSRYEDCCAEVASSLLQLFNQHDFPVNRITVTSLMNPGDPTGDVKRAALRKSVTRDTVISVAPGESSGETTVDTLVILTLKDSRLVADSSDLYSKVQAIVNDILAEQRDSLPEEYSNASDSELLGLLYSDLNMAEVRSRIEETCSLFTDEFSLQYNSRVYSNAESYKDLKSIYLMYMPLGNQWGAACDTIYLDLDSSVNESKPLDLYIVPQLSLVNDGSSIGQLRSSSFISPVVKTAELVRITRQGESAMTRSIVEGVAGAEKQVYRFKNTAGLASAALKLHYYSTEEDGSGYLDEGSKSSLLGAADSDMVSMLDSANTIYNITVEVYRHEEGASAFSRDSLLTSLTLAGC